MTGALATLIPLFERAVPLQVVPGVWFSIVSVHVQNVCVEGGKRCVRMML